MPDIPMESVEAAEDGPTVREFIDAYLREAWNDRMHCHRCDLPIIMGDANGDPWCMMCGHNPLWQGPTLPPPGLRGILSARGH